MGLEVSECSLMARTEKKKQESPPTHTVTSIHPLMHRYLIPTPVPPEFSTGLGEQCSICIGFSSSAGVPVGGLIYRPLSLPVTWAGGCHREGFREGELDYADHLVGDGLLTSNGSISPFVVNLMAELKYRRVASGGAGNKALMLLEGKGAAYIVDRGVSRWDTCAASAIIEAYGGTFSKLSSFIDTKVVSDYTYLHTESNLDFVPNLAALTGYNASSSSKGLVSKGGDAKAHSVDQVKPYSNLCGLLALCKSSREGERKEREIYPK
jgi:hypothetical protein